MFSKVLFLELAIIYAEIRALMTRTIDVVWVCMFTILFATTIDWGKRG